MDAWIATDTWCVPGRHSRARRVRGPPTDSSLEEHARTNQQDPPEILALIPDFWDTHKRDQDTIALTHVCRAWREVFVSQTSLWTRFDCLNGEKTRTYLERSKSSPSICRLPEPRTCLPTIHSSKSSPTLLDVSDPYR